MTKIFFKMDELTPHSRVVPTNELNTDLAPTSAAKCFNCRKKVPRRTPRVWYKDSMKKEVVSGGKKIQFDKLEVRRIICYVCAPIVLQTEYRRFETKMTNLYRQIKKFKRSRKGKGAKNIIQAHQMLEVMAEKERVALD